MALHAKWGWIVALGVIFMFAGVTALGSVVMATTTAVFVIGIMMIMAGVTGVIAPFSVKGWGEFTSGCCSARSMSRRVSSASTGRSRRPPSSPCSWARRWWWAACCACSSPGACAGGKPWGWVVVSGIISLLLGLMIIAKWPYSGFYVLGLFLGRPDLHRLGLAQHRAGAEAAAGLRRPTNF